MQENPEKLPNLQSTQQTSKKIRLLRQTIYPKKKKLTYKSHSVKVLPISSSNTRPIQRRQKFYQNDEKQLIQNQVDTAVSQKILKTTNLQFHTKKTNQNQVGTPWTIQNWLPGTNILKKKQIIQRQQQNKPIIYYSRSQFSQKKYQPRDAQSLLRKNSLFLLNFITTKQRKNNNMPHIGNFPFAFNKVQRAEIKQLKNHSHKINRGNRVEKQKKYVQNIRPWKEQKYTQKINQYGLHPEPW